MPRKTYVTTMPNKTGAFLIASKIIIAHGGNIIRVSYNKAIDLHTLFLDVAGDESSLREIDRELKAIGYINNKASELNVALISIRIPDKVGALLPVLEILQEFDINISYMNATQNKSGFQDFVMGLLVESPRDIETLVEKINKLYPVTAINDNIAKQNIDNTIFYVRFANEMRELLGLSETKTTEFISESNRVLQMLQRTNENPQTVFDSIRKFACFMAEHRNQKFNPIIESYQITKRVMLYSIEPPCGSNTYILHADGKLYFIDTGYAVYYNEMTAIFKKLFPGYDKLEKTIYITHADIDHCGLLSLIKDARIIVNEKTAACIKRQLDGILDFRESHEFCFGYTKLNRLISSYTPTDMSRIEIIDSKTPTKHDDLLKIGEIQIGDVAFDMLEGSGGHVYGETVFVSQTCGLIFPGDIMVNPAGFTAEMAEFNLLAPYFMKSVNLDSKKASLMRREISSLAQRLESKNNKPTVLCCGHGSPAQYENGKLVPIS